MEQTGERIIGSPPKSNHLVLTHAPAIRKTASKYVHNFSSNLADSQRTKQTDTAKHYLFFREKCAKHQYSRRRCATVKIDGTNESCVNT